MAKKIQVRIDDNFAVTHDSNRDSAIREAIHYRKSGGMFLSAEQSLANMRKAGNAIDCRQDTDKSLI